MQTLPARTGSYHPLEQPNPDNKDQFVGKPDFKGGLAMVWVVRYSQSPVGEYTTWPTCLDPTGAAVPSMISVVSRASMYQRLVALVPVQTARAL